MGKRTLVADPTCESNISSSLPLSLCLRIIARFRTRFLNNGAFSKAGTPQCRRCTSYKFKTRAVDEVLERLVSRLIDRSLSKRQIHAGEDHKNDPDDGWPLSRRGKAPEDHGAQNARPRGASRPVQSQVMGARWLPQRPGREGQGERCARPQVSFVTGSAGRGVLYALLEYTAPET